MNTDISVRRRPGARAGRIQEPAAAEGRQAACGKRYGLSALPRDRAPAPGSGFRVFAPLLLQPSPLWGPIHVSTPIVPPGPRRSLAVVPSLANEGTTARLR